MRGKHYTNGVDIALAGITPADAGKTISLCPDSAIARDHPRGCGENNAPAFSLLQPTGSPPRMRGKPFADAFGEPVHGITPADAGKTTERHSNLYAVQDHPRGCGENQF